jgi:hypothetical protein
MSPRYRHSLHSHGHVRGATDGVSTVDSAPRKCIRSPKVKLSSDDNISVHSVHLVVNSSFIYLIYLINI